jgi:uncharacterized membrane protein
MIRMTVKRTLSIVVLLALAGLAVSLLAYPSLPPMVPSHWNAAGEVDDTMQRGVMALMMPVLILALGLLLLYIPNIDPLRSNVERFRGVYNWFIVGFSAFFLYLHILIILAGLGAKFNLTYLLVPAFSLGMFGLGLVLERTKPNWFIGIRTPWTLSSPTVWEQTHRLGSLLFKLSAGVTLIGLLFSPQAAFVVMTGSILIAALASVIYSYFAYRKEKLKQGAE